MWAMAPRNTVLAAKSREAVQRVLMKKYNDIELEQFTESFARRIFSQSSESQEMKVKAASILVYLLEWGGDHGHCKRPTFTYEIAASTPEVAPEPPKVTVKPEALAKRQEELAEKEQPKEQPKEETTMEEQPKRPRGKQPRKVCKLDPETLKVIATYDSLKEACEKNDIKKIDGALKKHQRCHGFYYCYAEEADTFKPTTPMNVTKTESAPKPKPSPAPKKSSLADFTDAEIIDEMKRRGWKGSISFTLNVNL